MIIKEQVWNDCEYCRQHIDVYSATVYGCDECGKSFTDNHLETTMFQADDDKTVDYQFCSWKCFFKRLPNIKCDSFISMPYLQFKEGTGDCTATEFLDLIKERL